MVSFTVRMRFAEADVPRVRKILEALAPASRSEPGCVLYVPHLVEGEAGTVLIYEQYRDEAAAAAHRLTSHFQEHAVGGLYQLMLDRQMESLLAIC